MKLQELLKIDTSKSNWFKIFARNGINVKTVSSVSNGGGVSNSSKYAPRYFSIDFEKANDDWSKIMSAFIDDGNFNIFKIAASYKYFSDKPIITSYGYPDTINSGPYSFSYIPLYINEDIIGLLDSSNIQKGFKSLEEIIQIINIIAPKFDFQIDISMNGITEITEEEFYKIE